MFSLNDTRAGVRVAGAAVGLAAGALALVVAAGAAGDGEPTGVSAAAPAGEAAVCAPAEPCTLVNGYATPTTKDDDEKLVTLADVLDEARPASACPAIARNYAAVGIELDGVLGPCPSSFDAGSARTAAAMAASADLDQGGSR